jgi:hypothetical protein
MGGGGVRTCREILVEQRNHPPTEDLRTDFIACSSANVIARTPPERSGVTMSRAAVGACVIATAMYVASRASTRYYLQATWLSRDAEDPSTHDAGLPPVHICLLRLSERAPG